MLYEKWLVETNETLTLDTKNADPYKSTSTLRMITRTVMEDASKQSIHHNAKHAVISVKDIKKKRKKTAKSFLTSCQPLNYLKRHVSHETLSFIPVFTRAP
jgi:hypothetical protein